MKNRVVKCLITGLLALSMVFSMIPQAAMVTQAAEIERATGEEEVENALNLVWPEDMVQFHEWVRYGENPQAVQNNVIKALNEEYQRQKQDESFDIGTVPSNVIYSWNGLPSIQLDGGDNVTNPWNQAGRKWALIVCPYEGMAFTIKGKFAEGCGKLIPAANQVTYNGKTWQVFTDCLKFIENDELKGWGYNAGSGASGNCVDALDRAYSQSAWYNESMEGPWHLGTITNNVKKEGNIVYQQCEGNMSNGKIPGNNTKGISYLVAANSAATEAYVITHDMFNAWTTTWKSNEEKFANSGAPLGNQYITADGEIAQEFENFTIVLEGGSDPYIIQAKAEIEDYTIAGGETIQDGNDIVVFVPGNQDVSNLVANFTVTKGGTVDKKSGTTQNFSSPVTYTVTSETGAEYQYNVTVVAVDESKVTDAQRKKAEIYNNKFKLLNAPLTLGDKDTISYLETEFWALDGAVKYLAKEQYKSLKDVKTELEIITKEEPALKVACVGDSITELSPNYVTPLADLFDSDRVAFNNYGVSGYCMVKKANSINLSYWDTQKFANSKDLNPDIVTIMLGTNDADSNRWNNLGFKDTYKEDLAAMVDVYRELESAPEVVILASPASYPETDSRAVIIKNEVNILKQEVAEEKGCVYVDLHSITAGDQSMTRDNLHPSNKGTQVMADAIASAFNTSIIGTGVSEITLDGEPLEAGQQYYRIIWEDKDSFPELEVTTENGNAAVITHEPTAEEPYYIFKVNAKRGNYAKQYMVEFGEKIVEEVPDDDKDENTNGGNTEKPDTGNTNPSTNTGTGNTGTENGKDTGKEQSPVAVERIQITGNSKNIAAGKKITLNAKVMPANASDKAVTWKSSNTKWATVDKNGVVKTKKAGKNKTVTITATSTDGSSISAEYKIKIMEKAVKKIKLTANKSMKAGRKMKIKATVTPKASAKKINAKLTWKSSNTKWATVNKNGVVTAKKAGKNKTVTITATSTDGTNRKAKIKIKIK